MEAHLSMRRYPRGQGLLRQAERRPQRAASPLRRSSAERSPSPCIVGDAAVWVSSCAACLLATASSRRFSSVLRTARGSPSVRDRTRARSRSDRADHCVDATGSAPASEDTLAARRATPRSPSQPPPPSCALLPARRARIAANGPLRLLRPPLSPAPLRSWQRTVDRPPA